MSEENFLRKYRVSTVPAMRNSSQTIKTARQHCSIEIPHIQLRDTNEIECARSQGDNKIAE